MNSQDTELIFRFLENELSEEEQKEFRHKYETDAVFAGEVKAWSGIWISLKAAGKVSQRTFSGKPRLFRFLASRPSPRHHDQTDKPNITLIATNRRRVVILNPLRHPCRSAWNSDCECRNQRESIAIAAGRIPGGWPTQ